jgi:uncharacterized protein
VIRTVLDTNQIVSMAIRPGGIQDRILTAWRERRFILLTSPQLLAEIHRVLTYPKLRALIRLSSEEETALLRLLVEDAEMTPGTLRVQVVAADPADDMALECGIEGHADYIVSGDRHLLSLREHAGIPIITARQFLQILELEPPPRED